MVHAALLGLLLLWWPARPRLAAGTPAATPQPGGISIVPVFSRGEGGCSAFRIPGIHSLNRTLLVFSECRKYGCADFEGQHNVVYKRSTDGGASFSEMQTLLDPMQMFPPEVCPTDSASVRSQNHSCQFWDPTPVVDRHTGVVFLLATRGWAHDGMTSVESRMNSRGDMWVLNSTDVGASAKSDISGHGFETRLLADLGLIRVRKMMGGFLSCVQHLFVACVSW